LYGTIVLIGTGHESILGVFPELPVGLCMRAILVASGAVIIRRKDRQRVLHARVDTGAVIILFWIHSSAGRALYMQLNMYPKRLLQLKEAAVPALTRSRRPRTYSESRSCSQAAIGKVDGEPPLRTA